MRIKFQYVDWSEWEGPIEDAGQSPDCDVECPGDSDDYHPKGVIRMHAITDDGRVTEFLYDDLYYIYPENDGFVVGSGTPRRDYFFSSKNKWGLTRQRPVILPKNAVVRKGRTVSQEEALKFGLLKRDGTVLHDKLDIPVERQ